MTPTFPRDGVSGHAGAIHTHGITSHDLLSVLAVIVVAVRMVRWIVAKKS
jgi:hypothetical protein